MDFEPLTPARRRQQTRDYLLAAAARVFAERGFHEASLDEVAAAAGFTKGAVYSNFESKEDLVLAVLEARYQDNMATLRGTLDATGDHPEQHLSDFAGLIETQFGDEAPAWEALFLEFCVYALRNEPVRERLATFLAADVAGVAELIDDERERRHEPTWEPADHVAVIVTALMRGLNLMRSLNPDVVDEAVLESTLRFIARGLTGAAG
ncbi:MAG: TetR/AcrR family transcriptional regulator [Acidimicrobiales bacterium]